MLGQSTLNFKSRILDCFDFLQKSRNDGVSGIVIAFRFAYYAVIIRQIVDLLNQYKISVIARFGNAESWQSKQTLKIKSARSVNLRPLSVIARALPEAIQKIKSFCFVWFLQKVESPSPLDSNPQSEIPQIRYWLIYFAHCLKSFALDTSLRNATLSMTKKFGLLRRLQRLAMTIRRRFAQFIRFATFHTTFKGIKMQT